MASLGSLCGVNPPNSIHHRRGVDGRNPNNSNRIVRFRRSSSRRLPRISSTTTTTTKTKTDSASPSVFVPCFPNPGTKNGGVLFSETLDGWMRDSAVEVVKNLREAPLLVQVYANDDGGATWLKTEKAVAEEWPAVARRWKDGETPPPEGLILVEEIGREEESGTAAWGIVVQGRGAECGPECYLMKTSRVGSGCTHFCLVKKPEGFRETALSQLTNCWLLE